MNRFEYLRAGSLDEAIGALGAPGAVVLAGGTNLIDLMKYDVSRPARVIDISRLPLAEITALDAGGLRLGALAPNADAAHHALVQARAPLLASAILAGASAQLRNVFCARTECLPCAHLGPMS